MEKIQQKVALGYTRFITLQMYADEDEDREDRDRQFVY